MNIVDPGHKYELRRLDGVGYEILTFVKREGEGYPGNVGHHSGTTTQEVLRALIERAEYVDGQIPHKANHEVIGCLRRAIWELEGRAAERHGRLEAFLERFPPGPVESYDIETARTCDKCNHIGCEGACHA